MYLCVYIYIICINYLATSAFGDSNTSQAGCSCYQEAARRMVWITDRNSLYDL